MLKTRQEIEKEYEMYAIGELINPLDFIHRVRLSDIEAIEGVVEMMKFNRFEASYNLALSSLLSRLQELKKNL